MTLRHQHEGLQVFDSLRLTGTVLELKVRREIFPNYPGTYVPFVDESWPRYYTIPNLDFFEVHSNYQPSLCSTFSQSANFISRATRPQLSRVPFPFHFTYCSEEVLHVSSGSQ